MRDEPLLRAVRRAVAGSGGAMIPAVVRRFVGGSGATVLAARAAVARGARRARRRRERQDRVSQSGRARQEIQRLIVAHALQEPGLGRKFSVG